MTITLADAVPSWQSTISVAALLGTGVSILLSGLVVYFMWRQTRLMADAASKPAQQIISPQPLKVQIDEELHEKFADKEEFAKHVLGNTERHAQLFKSIERVERDTRLEIDRRFAALAQDRKETMEKLNNEFTFIRENIVEIKTELKIRHES